MKHGPPPKADISASALYARLSQETPNDRPFEIVDFPRNDKEGEPVGQLAMWPLKQREIIAAKSEATRKTREFVKDKQDQSETLEGYLQVWNDICATEMLVRCCRETDNRNIPIFPHGGAVRELLTSDEMSVMMNRYALVQVRLGPIVASLSTEEYDAWIDRLGEGGSELPLASLSWELRIALLMHSARQLRAFRTGSSSAGSPPGDPSSEPKKAPEPSENTA